MWSNVACTAIEKVSSLQQNKGHGKGERPGSAAGYHPPAHRSLECLLLDQGIIPCNGAVLLQG